MSTFKDAIGFALAHEGGFVNHKSDPGGATNFGVSLRWLEKEALLDKDGDGWPDGDVNHDGKIDYLDIRAMTVPKAMALYHDYWWEPLKYSLIVPQTIATKIFDTAINMGSSRAHKLAQQTCNKIFTVTPPLDVDGKLGPLSLSRINSTLAMDFRRIFCLLQKQFYQSLIDKKPAFSAFQTGWFNRAAAWPN